MRQKTTPDTPITLTVKELSTVLCSAVDAMEDSIFNRFRQRINELKEPAQPPPPPPPAVPPRRPLDVVMESSSTLPRYFKFSEIAPGSVFRIDGGSQPIIKLDMSQSWNAPAAHEANSYYLRTGNTTKIAPHKEVVLLKASIIISE